LPTAHTDLSATFYLLNTVDNGALNKFGNCSQWRSELLIPCKQQRYERSAILALAQ
jgi:hypothetical protein